MDGFERFWSVYPLRVGKKDARKAWEKIAPTIELTEKIYAAVESQMRVRKGRVERRQWVAEIAHPATWLRAERWEDETELRMTIATEDDLKQFREDMQRKRAGA